MASTRQKFSSQAAPEVLAGMRAIARREGRQFQEVLEEAMSCYIESKSQEKVRPEVMAHLKDSIERNSLLYELLAQ